MFAPTKVRLVQQQKEDDRGSAAMVLRRLQIHSIATVVFLQLHTHVSATAVLQQLHTHSNAAVLMEQQDSLRSVLLCVVYLGKSLCANFLWGRSQQYTITQIARDIV